MHSKNKAGVSVVELSISLSIVAVIAWPLIHFARSTSGALQTRGTAADVEARARRSADSIAERLRAASRASLVPPALPPPLSSTFVEFQRTLGFAGGAPIWGAAERIELRPAPGDPADGVDNDGDGLVDEGQVVLIENVGLAGERSVILCEDVGAALEGELPGNGIDDNRNGLVDEAGLCFDYSGGLVTLQLTLESLDSAGFRSTRTHRRAVALQVEGGP